MLYFDKKLEVDLLLNAAHVRCTSSGTSPPSRSTSWCRASCCNATAKELM